MEGRLTHMPRLKVKSNAMTCSIQRTVVDNEFVFISGLSGMKALQESTLPGKREREELLLRGLATVARRWRRCGGEFGQGDAAIGIRIHLGEGGLNLGSRGTLGRTGSEFSQ